MCIAQRERAALTPTLRIAGIDAPTLCDGWKTRDLAAGLMIREYRAEAVADGVVSDVLSADQIAAERAGVHLEASVPTQPVRVIGSDRALVRVLSNLVANAIAHTPSGATVKLALGSDSAGASARVDDTGLVQAHRGSLSARNTAHGAPIEVRLPLAD